MFPQRDSLRNKDMHTHKGTLMDKTETQKNDSEFDPATAPALQAVAAKKLQALLKAKQEANKAASSREFAVRCLRGLEATVHQLFDAGASSQDILSQLIDALPDIPADELRYALKMLGGKNKRLRSISAVHTEPVTPSDSGANEKISLQPIAKKKPPAPADKMSPHPQKPIGDLPAWADGSDKRVDESDEDYRLRKEIEGPPEARHKFIGEHDT